MSIVFRQIILLLLIVLLVNVANASSKANISERKNTTLVKIMPPESEQDYRYAFKRFILKRALQETQHEFGDYSIAVSPGYMTNLRAFRELKKKEGVVNTIFSLTTEERERESIGIEIPIRRGLLNYRLLLVKKELVEEFSKIKTLDELKKKTMGMGANWITSHVAEHHGFNLVYGAGRNSLFKMLSRQRFDYFMLGINEIYLEYEKRDLNQLGLAVVPNIAVYINMPLYIFVSKSEPDIAKRIRKGLESLVARGEFERIFFKEYGDYIRKAALSERHIIHLSNPMLPDTVPLSRKELWYLP